MASRILRAAGAVGMARPRLTARSREGLVPPWPYRVGCIAPPWEPATVLALVARLPQGSNFSG